MGDKSIPKLRFPEFIDEWERRKLGEVAIEFKSGVSLRADEIEHNGAYPVYGGNGLRGYTSTYNHDGEFALIGRQGALCGNMNYSVGKAYFTEHAVVVQANENNDTRFIYYLLDTMQLGQYSDQSAQPGLAVNKLIKLENVFPDKTEQVKISTYFSTLDHLITLHQRKCYCLKKLRDGIIQKILSRELRFKRADGREFENWVTKELWEILTERKVSQTITEDAPLLSFTIEQGVIKPQDKKTNKRDFLIKDKETKKFALTEVDDIIYNPANLKYGAIHRNKLMRGVVSPIYAIFYTEQNPAFMEYVVKNPIFIKKSMKYLEGTVIKLMTLKPRDFLKLKVEIPASLEEQKIIADFLMKFDETIDAEQKRIEKWKELKKGLLQQMFV